MINGNSIKSSIVLLLVVIVYAQVLLNLIVYKERAATYIGRLANEYQYVYDVFTARISCVVGGGLPPLLRSKRGLRIDH